MEDMFVSVISLVSGFDAYVVAASALVVALAGVAKLTKTKKDDKVISKADKFLGYFKRNKTKVDK